MQKLLFSFLLGCSSVPQWVLAADDGSRLLGTHHTGRKIIHGKCRRCVLMLTKKKLKKCKVGNTMCP